MRAIITTVIAATTIISVGVSPALASCGSSSQPLQVGAVSGDAEKDSFGLLCSGAREQAGSVATVTRAEIMQVGASTGEAEKDSFGYVQAASLQ
jgi:hypothetical protein